MPVITIAQSKGGAGKTTLALALASEFEALGVSGFMLAADRQNTFRALFDNYRLSDDINFLFGSVVYDDGGLIF